MEGSSTMKSLRVLIIDDVTFERKFSSRILRNFNFQIVEAVNGKEAVDLAFSGEKFDLVLMDRSMPVMDGITATKMLREMGGDFKIIALTSDAEFKDKFAEAGADEFFIKPLEVKKLKEVLKKFELIA